MITSVASTTDVVLGQILEGVGIGSVAQYLPYDATCMVTVVGANSITFAG